MHKDIPDTKAATDSANITYHIKYTNLVLGKEVH